MVKLQQDPIPFVAGCVVAGCVVGFMFESLLRSLRSLNLNNQKKGSDNQDADDEYDDGFLREYYSTLRGGGHDSWRNYGPPSDKTCYPITVYDHPPYTQPSEEALDQGYGRRPGPVEEPNPAFGIGLGSSNGRRPEEPVSDHGRKADCEEPDLEFRSGYGRKPEAVSEYGSGYGRKTEFEEPNPGFGSGYGHRPEPVSEEYGSGYGGRPQRSEYEAPPPPQPEGYGRRDDADEGYDRKK